jgi:hypothetical protein
MTPIELTTAIDGCLDASGIDPDRHTYMTPADTRALEAQCRAAGLIED